MPDPGHRPLSPDDFAAATGVSRETLARLQSYVSLLRSWQRRINLVSSSTLADPWRRHVLDSAQLHPHLPAPDVRLYDIGSGAGFPGLVLAIMGASDVHLIESDQRKAAFLREAARITSTRLHLHVTRAERLAPVDADVITSRACAALPALLELSSGLIRAGTVCLFLKGRDVEAELTSARKHWKMRATTLRSLSDPTGVILRLEDLHHV